MIAKDALRAFIEKEMTATGYFLVDLTVSESNEIKVEVDSDENVDIDYCISLTRKIEEAFSRDDEDYELEVGSAGLTTPFKVPRQYQKHIGDEVEVLPKGGKKQKGILLSADEEGFAVEVTEKVKPEGAKRPVLQTVEVSYKYSEVSKVTYVLNF